MSDDATVSDTDVSASAWSVWDSVHSDRVSMGTGSVEGGPVVANVPSVGREGIRGREREPSPGTVGESIRAPNRQPSIGGPIGVDPIGAPQNDPPPPRVRPPSPPNIPAQDQFTESTQTVSSSIEESIGVIGELGTLAESKDLVVVSDPLITESDSVVTKSDTESELRPQEMGRRAKRDRNRAELFKMVYVGGIDEVTAFNEVYPRRNRPDNYARTYVKNELRSYIDDNQDDMTAILNAADLGKPRLASEIQTSLSAEKTVVVGDSLEYTPDENIRHKGRELLAKVHGAGVVSGPNTQVNVGIKFDGEMGRGDWEQWAKERQT